MTHTKSDKRSYLILYSIRIVDSRSMSNGIVRYVLYAQMEGRSLFYRQSGNSSDYTARRISHFVFVQVAGTGSYLFHLRAG